MISRILASARPSARLASKTLQSLFAMPVRAFATQGGGELAVAKSKSKLAKTLVKELQHEEENYTKDEGVEKFLKDNNFSLLDKEDWHEVELKKKVGDTTVTIVFSARSPQVNEEGEGQPQQEGGQDAIEQKQEGAEGEEGGAANDMADFNVYLQRDGEKSALVAECTSFDGEVNINYLNAIQSVESHRKLSKFDRASEYYPGPEFNTLDERLQTTFLEYIRGYGINEELVVFIEHLSLDKEQRLYMRWLKNLAKFTGGSGSE